MTFDVNFGLLPGAALILLSFQLHKDNLEESMLSDKQNSLTAFIGFDLVKAFDQVTLDLQGKTVKLVGKRK